MIDVKLHNVPLDLIAINNLISDPSCGGLSVFIGNVRNNHKGKAVTHLFFEAYEPMAIKEMDRIAQSAKETFKVSNVVVHHRLGHVGIGESAVIIGVSAPHRIAARKACAFIIDTLKERVPIWKKEFLEDGSYWVNATP